jgi:5-methylcytosine-specific restriction endonuclease McrA
MEFQPRRDSDRCCSEQHGKRLYNRESRADGRQKPPPWSDARRDRYHRRRAQKQESASGPVLLAEIANRDQWRCHLCGSAVDSDLSWPDPMSPSLDHVVPLSLGGPHTPENVRLAHVRCNTAKGNRGGEEQVLLAG